MVFRVFVGVYRVFVKKGEGGVVHFYSFGAKPVQNHLAISRWPLAVGQLLIPWVFRIGKTMFRT
jgi:hypothetical protein